MLAPFVAVLAAAILAAAPTKPLFDTKPATIDGVRYERERIYEGDYIKGFEVSDFNPLGQKAPSMWLQGWSGSEGAHHIRFIGRRTAKPGRYGHLGAYRHMVLITDMIDARPKPDLANISGT